MQKNKFMEKYFLENNKYTDLHYLIILLIHYYTL